MKLTKKHFFSIIAALLLLTEHASAIVAAGWEKHVIASQKTPIYLYVKDIDKDGDLDIVSTTNRHPNPFNSEVAWFQNNLNHNRPWKKFIISSSDPKTSPAKSTNGIIAADIDGDGHEDVAVASGTAKVAAGNIYWFKAPENPAGRWQRFDIDANAKNSYFKIYTIDANKDGKKDLIAGGTRGAFLFINPGNPVQPGVTWEKIPLTDDAGETGSSIYVDDLNGDGKADLINSYEGTRENGFTGNVSWFDISFKGGKVTFNRTMIAPELKWAFDNNCMDVNGDKKKDLLVTVFKDPHIYWYEAPSKKGGSWTKHLVTDSLKGTDMSTGDIDGDGKKDFVVSGLFQKKISWFKYNKTMQAWTENPVDDNIAFPGDISLDDLDKDGDLDVVLAGMGANQMIWYENKTGN